MQAAGNGAGQRAPAATSGSPAAPPAATPGSPAAPPSSISGQQPQLSHQSPRVDREDSGTTCFHCFLSQERGWHHGIGDAVFLLLARVGLHFPGSVHPLLSPVALGPCRRAEVVPGVQGLLLPGPPCLHQGDGVHSLVHPWRDLLAIWGPQHSGPKGSLFPHLHPGIPEEDRPQRKESVLLSSRPPSPPHPPLCAPRGQACVVKNLPGLCPGASGR